MHSLFNAHFCSPYSDDFDALAEQFLAWDAVFFAVVKWDDLTVFCQILRLTLDWIGSMPFPVELDNKHTDELARQPAA